VAGLRGTPFQEDGGYEIKDRGSQRTPGSSRELQVSEIGDCVRAASVGEAIQEGYIAAMSII